MTNIIAPTVTVPVAQSGQTSTQPLTEYEKKCAALKQVTQQFEGMFLDMIMKQMRTSLKQDHPMFGGGFAAETYQGMMDQQLTTEMSKSGSFGLAQELYTELKPLLPGAPTSVLKTGVKNTVLPALVTAGVKKIGDDK